MLVRFQVGNDRDLIGFIEVRGALDRSFQPVRSFEKLYIVRTDDSGKGALQRYLHKYVFLTFETLCQYLKDHFKTLSPLDLTELHAYLTNIALLPPSWSEHSYAYLLHPGGSGRYPLEHRIHALADHIAVTFIYPERDWMDPTAGSRCVEILKEKRGASMVGRGVGEAKTVLVLDAGHQGEWSCKRL